MLTSKIKNEDWTSVRQAIAKLNKKLGPLARPTHAGLTLTDMVQGSVIFAGPGGLISQDNDNLFWDDTNNYLGIGTSAPTRMIHHKRDNEMTLLYESQSAPSGDRVGAMWYGANTGTFYFGRFNDAGTSMTRMDMNIQASTGNLAVGVPFGEFAKTRFTVVGTVTLKEQAAADADTAAYSQVWAKTASPSELWHTDDTGIDTQIAPQDLRTSASPTFAGLDVNGTTETDRLLVG